MHLHERNEIDKIFYKQQPPLKHNLPIETLGVPPPPNGGHVFELIQLLDNFKYAYLNEKKRYIMLLLVLTFQNMKKKDY